MALNGIVTSDWHLNGMGKVFPRGDATGHQIKEIHKPYQYALSKAISHMFVPGDLSDTPTMDEHTLIALVTLLLTYDDCIDTYYMLGNHDFAHETKTSCDVLKVFTDNGFFKRFHLFYKPEVRKIEGIHCAFMPFPHNDVPECPKPPLVFAHLEVAGAIGDNGRLLKGGNDDKFIRQPGDYVMSGHIHQFQILKAKRFTYCGTLYQKNFGEALPKGWVEFEAKYVNGKLVVVPTFVGNKPDFILETKLITSSDGWDTLVRDDSVKYKILIDEGVIVPKNVMRDFPNIIYLMGASKGVKVKMGQEEQGVDASLTLKDLPTFSPITGLKKYLLEAEFGKKQIKRAQELVREARAELNV